jgi:hypothetical protein
MNYYDEKDEPTDEPRPVCGVRPSGAADCLKCKEDCPYTVIGMKNLCIHCGEQMIVLMPKYLFDKWVGGMMLQQVMPNMPSEVREMLITKICLPCQDFMKYAEELIIEDEPIELNMLYSVSMN